MQSAFASFFKRNAPVALRTLSPLFNKIIRTDYTHSVNEVSHYVDTTKFVLSDTSAIPIKNDYRGKCFAKAFITVRVTHVAIFGEVEILTSTHCVARLFSLVTLSIRPFDVDPSLYVCISHYRNLILGTQLQKYNLHKEVDLVKLLGGFTPHTWKV